MWSQEWIVEKEMGSERERVRCELEKLAFLFLPSTAVFV